MPRKSTGEKEMLSLRIDVKLKRAVANLADRERRSMTGQVEILLQAGFEALGEKIKGAGGKRR